LLGTVTTQMIGVVNNLHITVLQIYYAIFPPNIIKTSQNLTKLLQKLKRSNFIRKQRTCTQINKDNVKTF